MISSFCVAQELREKNWKAMDALSEMEKNVNNKVKTAVQKIKVEKYLHSSRMLYSKFSQIRMVSSPMQMQKCQDTLIEN